ncbi:MAG: hypothetical protein AYP45_11350 [Candidatus Brocadia carolinensis]|uniref:OmpH family outer membrane protein n=1 Tax=Candidatus Brocadia carolinensis TaxID=1004156 RepID=A0A1V4ASM0_9BACT|nr:MAG: hypothetical protein AYP45_11350 [Candidatus Brocadia caroliniensis]
MSNSRFQYGLSLAIICCIVCLASKTPYVIAQDVVQSKEAFEGGMDDLKKQLKQMEEAFLAQQKMMKQMESVALSSRNKSKN